MELLGVAWSVEFFNNYFYVKKFSVITNHRTFLSIPSKHQSNKSYSSRLSRGIDSLFSFQFKTEHLAGGKMCYVVYMSRNPYQPVKFFSNYYEEILVATFSIIQSDAKLLQSEKIISATYLIKIF